MENFKSSIVNQKLPPKVTLMWAYNKYGCDVKRYETKDDICYKCKGISFNDLDLAVKFAQRYCRIKSIDNQEATITRVREMDKGCQIRRRHLPKRTQALCQNVVTEVCYPNFDIRPYLGKNNFNLHIWHIIWNGFTYPLFSRNDYRDMKDRFLKEINMYRELHDSFFLFESLTLTEIAQYHADYLAKYKLVSRKFESMYGETVGVAFYPASSVIVKKWYDESLFYKFGSKNPVYGTQMFTQMMWKESRRIGIGIARNDDVLWLVCKYSPKGNIRGRFRENVLPLSKNKEKRSFWSRMKALKGLKG
ncbi:CAP domain-containing protein [Strongyloides ratti]|nr:CAP domain-containing protein [Strongyloides ratti]CEF66117.1 CAP domain-containing protein [Strongyloides ratti]